MKQYRVTQFPAEDFSSPSVIHDEDQNSIFVRFLSCLYSLKTYTFPLVSDSTTF